MMYKPTNLTKKERAQIAKMKKINPDYVVGTQFDMFFNREVEYKGEHDYRKPEVGEVVGQKEFRFFVNE